MFRLFSAALALVLTTAVLAGRQQAASPAAQPASPVVQQRPDSQVPPVTFRSEVSFVEVDAIVRDARGSFVRDLEPEEFQVLEDGVPQTVTAFSLIDIPVVQPDRALFLPQEIDPDVRTNYQGPPGRIYVLLLDDVHTAFERSVRVRQIARDFIQKNLGANDLVAVLHTSGRSDAAQDFTNSRRLLQRAADKFVGRKLRSAYLNRLDVYTRNRNNGDTNVIGDADDAERLHHARGLLETIENLSEWLGSIHGRRKALVLIGEGIDYSLYGASTPIAPTSSTSSGSSGSSDTGSSSSASSQLPVSENRGDGLALAVESQQALAAATRANVNVYAIDPRGLAVGTEDQITVSGSPAENPSLGLSSTDMMDELRRSQDSLRVLAEGTGGFASVSSNDFAPALRRIVEENSSYYMLGYHPTNTKRDGRFRRIEVRLTRPGRLEVKARKGYDGPSGKPAKVKGGKAAQTVEASAGTSRELREALENPVQATDLRFAVFAAPLKGPDKKAVVAVVSQFNGQDIAFMTAGGKRTNALEISYVAVNSEGKVAGGNRERIDLSLKPETYQRVLQAGFRVQSRFELPPGTYQLRVAAREAGGRVGSVHYDLLVPDFGEQSLGISGLVLTSKTAAVVPTAGTIPELGQELASPPTTARAFRTRDELTVLAEVYDNYPKRKHSVDIRTLLKAEGGLPVFSSSETRSSEELGNSKGGYGHTATIPLANLAPGLYVLRIEAKSTLRGALGVARELQIQVVP